MTVGVGGEESEGSWARRAGRLPFEQLTSSEASVGVGVAIFGL